MVLRPASTCQPSVVPDANEPFMMSGGSGTAVSDVEVEILRDTGGGDSLRLPNETARLSKLRMLLEGRIDFLRFLLFVGESEVVGRMGGDSPILVEMAILVASSGFGIVGGEDIGFDWMASARLDGMCSAN